MYIKNFNYRAPEGVKCWAVCMNGDSWIEHELTALRNKFVPLGRMLYPPHITVWTGNDPAVEDELMKISIDEMEIIRTFFVHYHGKYLTGYTINNSLLQSYYDLNYPETILHITLYSDKRYKDAFKVYESLPILSGRHKMSKKYVERIDPRYTCYEHLTV